MFAYVLTLLFSIQLSGPAAQQDEVKDALAHAEALYYEARFKDSIQLLTRVDELLRGKTDRPQDRINAKVQLALAYIGLNDNEQAKAFFREVYSLDPNYVIDTSQFSPKIISLANEARADAGELRCVSAREDARKKLDAGNAMGVMAVIGSMKSQCKDLAAFEPATADLLYRSGLESYKRADYRDAVQKFKSATTLDPKHELAGQYYELTQSKLQVKTDQLLIAWRRDYEARQLTQAAADYRIIKASTDGSNAQAMAEIQTEYRRALTELVETWNRTCATGSEATMNGIKTLIAELLPEPSFGEDIRGRMTTCSRSSGCMQAGAALALTRLKTKVNPEISPTLRSFLREPQTVRVKTKIDETGNVVMAEAVGTNPMLNNVVRNAVERWKFAPAIDANGPRCVETEIPIIVGP
jgi:Periplasmic protein TonB, links inner and outer membranes